MTENKHYDTTKVVSLQEHRRKLDLIRYTPEQLKFDLGMEPVPAFKDIFFSPVFLFQTCLPMREPRPSDLVDGAYVRRNGRMKMEIRSSLGTEHLPWGKFPRQFLMWLTNAIKRFPNAVDTNGYFNLDMTYREFCASVGVDPSSGANGSGRKLLGQIVRLMSTNFTITFTDDGATTKRNLKTRHFSVSSEMDLTWDEKLSRPKQWLDQVDGQFKLSKDFHHEINLHAFPVPAEHLALVCRGKSPLRIDAYNWAVYRVGYYHLKNRPALPVPWKSLHGQFGSNGSIYEFVRQFNAELDWIKANVWPGLQWTVKDDASLLIHKVDLLVDLRRVAG